MTVEIIQGDCLEAMRAMPAASVDLVFTSPPYEAARTYGIEFKLKGQEFVDWCVERYLECLRVSKGLVAWVIEGQTRQFRYSASPLLLMADLHRKGVHLRKPPVYRRDGIPGSGGPDWLANKYEFIVCATNGGKLPWSDNTAMGHPPKYGPGGAMSNRLSSGARVNQWGAVGGPGSGNGTGGQRPSHRLQRGNEKGSAASVPVLANPGNIINCGAVGGGNMGSEFSHENEAPFPEKLAEFFIRSFCPPNGTVLDPFSGSGTTIAVAKRCGRNGIAIDIRESQVDLAKRRIATVQRELIA